jgi:hypothetical protein
MSGITFRLVLIHKKTKQRYPLRGEDFVIGRSQGNLVFDHDPKLSGKHCLIRLTPQGFAIHDLKTRTGVYINGTQLPAGKACILKPGSEVSVGDQHFAVAEETKNRTKKEWGVNPIFVLSGLAVTAGALFLLTFQPKSRAHLSSAGNAAIPQMMSVDAEMREALNRMQYFDDMVRRHQFTEEQSLKYLREELVPRFSSVHTQLQAYKPNPKEEKRVDLTRRMAGAYLGRVTALANYIQTKDVRYSVEFGEYNRQMQVLNEQVQQEMRRPTSQ